MNLAAGQATFFMISPGEGETMPRARYFCFYNEMGKEIMFFILIKFGFSLLVSVQDKKFADAKSTNRADPIVIL